VGFLSLDTIIKLLTLCSAEPQHAVARKYDVTAPITNDEFVECETHHEIEKTAISKDNDLGDGNTIGFCKAFLISRSRPAFNFWAVVEGISITTEIFAIGVFDRRGMIPLHILSEDEVAEYGTCDRRAMGTSGRYVQEGQPKPTCACNQGGRYGLKGRSLRVCSTWCVGENLSVGVQGEIILYEIAAKCHGNAHGGRKTVLGSSWLRKYATSRLVGSIGELG
jgi:hypothetical protein